MHFYSFKYNQQDATLYNILFTVNALHVSGKTCRALTVKRILYNVASCCLYLKEYSNDEQSHERQRCTFLS
jgi:hypothetical protein